MTFTRAEYQLSISRTNQMNSPSFFNIAIALASTSLSLLSLPLSICPSLYYIHIFLFLTDLVYLFLTVSVFSFTCLVRPFFLSVCLCHFYSLYFFISLARLSSHVLPSFVPLFFSLYLIHLFSLISL